MSKEKLAVSVSLQMQKPPHEVYEAIVDPAKMTQYFISKSSGRMEEGKVLTWRFPEFDFEFPVRVGKLVPDEYVSFYWGGEDELLVEMKLVPYGDGSTVVYITEKDKENDEAGVKWLVDSTEGWTHCLACLKAYLEYGINLRKGGLNYRNP